MTTKSNYKICSFEASEIDKLVYLHQQIFPEYFLTNLGPDVLRQFYLWFNNSDKTYINVIKSDDRQELFGLAMLTGEYDELFGSFTSSHKILIIKGIFKGLLTLKKPVYLGLYSRLASFFSKNKDRFDYRYSLVSLGVHPDIQHASLGSKLVASIERELEEINVDKYSLSVKKNNPNAIRFYQKMNFKKIGENDKLIYLGKKL